MKTKFNGILTLLLAFTVHFAFAQKTVSGIVSDESGPLPGVSVLIKGTTTGTETDFDGKYSLQANSGDVLQFSYIGMETAFKTVGSSNVIDVVMTGGNVLDEVVITAGVAGATSKKKMSVSVESVRAEDINQVPTASASSALQGKVSGVSVTNLGRPGSGSTIILRGAANLYGSQEPLVVMDGVIVEGGLSDINIDDIQSMEIVKGASASSFYGSRAGNGVIVIKTKRGKFGKTAVTFRSELGMSRITNFVKTNQSHHYVLADDWEDYKGQYTRYAGVTFPDSFQGVYTGYSADTDPDLAIIGSPTPDDDHYSDNPYGVYNNHQDAFFKTGMDRTLYASLSTGSENSRFFVSAENTNAEGVLKEAEGYERNSIRANADINVNDWITVKASNNFIRINDHSPVGNDDFYRTLTRLGPDAKPLLDNPDGQPYYFKPDPWDSEINNPLYSLYARDASYKRQRFLGGYNLNLKFTDWVNADLEYSFENDDYNYLSYNKYESYETSSGAGLGFQYSTGSLYSSNYHELSQKAQFNLNFKESFGDLDFTGRLSYLLENRNYGRIVTRGSSFLYPNLVTFDNFDSKNVKASSHNEIEIAKDMFAIAGFVFKDRYIFDALYRKDASSLFGENERMHDYYRVSAAYRISQDIEIPGVNELKINAAMGTSGQRPGFDWQYNRFPIQNGTTSTDVYVANPDLKGSLTTEKEIGLTASLFNMFDLNMTYSNQVVSDQFMSADVFPPAYPGNKMWINVGDLTSDVYEASLHSKILKKDNLKWDVGINFTKAKTFITKLDKEQFVGPNGGQIFRIKEGEEFGNMFGRVFVSDLETMAAQLPDGDNIDNYAVNSDGVVVDSRTIGTILEKPIIKVDENGEVVSEVIGNQNADFRVGLTSNITYKNIGFYMLWDWKQGGDIYNRNAQWNTIKNRSAMVDQSGKDDSEKKTVDYYAALYDVNQDNGFWVEDGTFIKMREISLSYTFNNDAISKIFDDIKLSIIGKNLLTFTNYSGWDPEVTKYDSNTMQYYSIDYGVYPNQSTYSFSLQLKF